MESLHLAAPSPPRHKVQLLGIAFSNKFATQSIGSLLVGATPVILKGWRHVSSWFLAFALVQIAPRDVVYDALTRHVFLAFVVKVGAALYKLRKFNFVVSACPHCSLQFLLMVMLVDICVEINQRVGCSSLSRVDGVRALPDPHAVAATLSSARRHVNVHTPRRSRSTATTRVVGA